MASKILLLAVAVGAVVVSVVPASGAPPVQPPRIRADVVVMGFVPCSKGTSMGPLASSAPGFPNALVQLRCKDDDDAAGASAVTASATTDGRGRFRMATNTTVGVSSSVARVCGLVVATPLASCDAALPAAGTLESGLRLVVGVVFFPLGFSYVAAPSHD